MKGFTLIELIVTMGVALLLTGGIIAGYNTFSDTQKLKQAALTLENNLRLAENQASSATKPPTDCGVLRGIEVSFTDEDYTIQAMCEALAGSLTHIDLPAGLNFNPIPSSLLFLILDQGVNIDAPQILTITSVSQNYRLKVSPTGEITDCGLIACP